MTTLPVINVESLGICSGGQALQGVAEAIRSACQEAGFFYLEGHGVDPALIAAAFEANRRFHALPLQEKQAVAYNRWHRGYLGFGGAQLKASSRFEPARAPNLMESYFLRHEVATDHPDCLEGRPLQGPNQWPTDPEFKDVIRRYDSVLRDLGLQLLSALSVAIGQEPTFLQQYFAPPSTALRLNHYPPNPALEGIESFGSHPHTDYGFLTLLLQDSVGGLEVEGADGQWFPVPYRKNAFVVNIGDIFARWTNDAFNSTPHRVINQSTERDRYSMAYFFDPNLDAVIDCLPAFRGVGDSKYESIRFIDYFASRLDANYQRERTA